MQIRFGPLLRTLLTGTICFLLIAIGLLGSEYPKGPDVNPVEACGVERSLIRVDTSANRLRFWCGDRMMLDAACSTGSGRSLKTEKVTWIFDTPLGEFKIREIARDPVWRKPDWAYLEAGEELPESEEARFVEGQLGEYALELGDGIFIHGTIYERLLGESVTHGCIRLGAEDLRFLAERVEVGTPVEIY